MGFRVNRRISLGKNVRVNIGKRGVSTSVKIREDGTGHSQFEGTQDRACSKGRLIYHQSEDEKKYRSAAEVNCREQSTGELYSLICRQHATSAPPKDFEAARNPVQGV